jgi:surface protein
MIMDRTNSHGWLPHAIALSVLALAACFLVLSLNEQPGTRTIQPAPSLATSSDPDAFLSTWTTTNPGVTTSNQIILPLVSNGTYDFIIAWGDGTSNMITVWDQSVVTHTYASPGTYRLNITGRIDGWCFGNGGDCQKLVGISQWGCLQLGNGGSYFAGCLYLVLNATDAPGLTGTTSLANCFLNCGDLGSNGNMNSWEVSNVTDMADMFANDYSFNQPVGAWTVSRVTDMDGMFSSTPFNQDISAWNVTRVTSMDSMFSGAWMFDQPIGAWNVSRVTDMASMFENAWAFNQSLATWNVSSVTSMQYMFEGYNPMSFNQPIGAWHVSSVRNMSNMFCYAKWLNQPLGVWNVSRVTDMEGMFSAASAFDQPIGGWNVSSVTDMSFMFSAASAFDQPIGGWNVSSVTEMEYLFSETPFNYDISSWDVSHVTDMAGTFSGTAAFNQNIGSWNVSRVKSMHSMFESAAAFDQPIDTWNVSAVTDMGRMFLGAESFDQPIEAWNVSSVNEMEYMFSGATAFNQPLGAWNVSAVTNMDTMFDGATAFDQSLSAWNVSAVTDMNDMFHDATAFNQSLVAWNVLHVTGMGEMFEGAAAFDQPIGAWNVSAVTGMGEMLEGAAAFDQPIGAWNVSAVTDMDNMFDGATSFDQPIGAWNVSAVTDMDNMFHNAWLFNQPIGAWDVSHVTDMAGMFSDAGAFNQPLGAWNVSAVTDMSEMFCEAWSFDQDIGTWNVATVQTMTAMFSYGNLSVYNYDALLRGWSNLTLHTGVIFDAGYSHYDGTAVTARTELVSDYSWSISDGGLVTVAPGVPLVVTAVAGNTQVKLVWATPADNGGAAVMNYRIFMGTSPGAETALVTIGNVTTYTATGLVNGLSYYFTVAAVNYIGTGANTTNIFATPATVPGAPTNLSVTPSSGQVSLNWIAPSANGGSAITGYDIFVGVVPDTERLNVQVGNATSYSVTGLTNGQTYYFVVAARNVMGAGSNTSEASAMPVGVPIQPTGMTATAGNEQVVLTWTAPSNDGGSTILGYDVYVSTVSGVQGDQNNTELVTGTSFTVTNLVNGRNYYFEVAAINALGTGSPSIQTSAVPATIPGPPQSLVVTPGDKLVVLSWTAPVDNGGSAITAYKIYMGTAQGTETLLTTLGDVLTYTATGLTAGKTYYFEISAVNAAGEGANSTEVSAVPSGSPATPGYSIGLLMWTLLLSLSGILAADRMRRSVPSAPRR